MYEAMTAQVLEQGLCPGVNVEIHYYSVRCKYEKTSKVLGAKGSTFKYCLQPARIVIK